MRLHIVLFAAGVWWLQQQAQLPDAQWTWTLVAIVPAIALARTRHAALRCTVALSTAATAIAAGFLWAALLADLRLSDALPAACEGRDIEVIGVVASLPQMTERSVRFELDVEQVLTAGASVPQRVGLSWWGRPGAAPQAHAGERWRFTVRLKRPHGMANPNGFDFEAWLLERGVRATGYVRPRAAERLDAMVHRPAYWVEAARERLRARILHGLADRPYAGIIAALAIGDQRAIPPHQWQVFTRTGVNHLMSISGLHVTMVATLAYALALMLWRRSARLSMRLPAPKAAALAGVIAAFLYTLLAGFAVPAQRTLYMVCIVAAALWCGKATSASVVLAAALLIVLLLDPWAVTSAGFWLSFGAVAAILFVVVNRVVQAGWLEGWLRTQWAVTVALLPLLLALFQQVSLISPVANAFAIPVVSFIVAPLALIGMLLPFDGVLELAHLAMACCMYGLELLSAAPDAVWEQHAPPVWAIPLAAAGTLWLTLPRGVPARWLGAVVCLPLFFVFPSAPKPGELALTVLDVGQGAAIVARTARHALLYDTGPAFGPGVDSGNRIIAPYLRATGVRRLDGLVVSHDNADHSGGALSVLQTMPVAWLASPLPDMDPLPLVADHAFVCAAGTAWEWDGVRFEIVHPPLESYAARVKENDRSCVVRIIAHGGAMLLTGDIEYRTEEALVAQRTDLQADVILAPHHGSKSSSTAAFLDAVRPAAVVFAVGYRNRFGHPHAEVVERYVRRGVSLYRTDTDGALSVAIVAEGIRIERYRSTYRRYWLDPPGSDNRALEAQLDTGLR